MDFYPDFNDVWNGGLMWEHLNEENQIPEDDDGVLGDDPFEEGGD
jgi:hypothetical protein